MLIERIRILIYLKRYQSRKTNLMEQTVYDLKSLHSKGILGEDQYSKWCHMNHVQIMLFALVVSACDILAAYTYYFHDL